jgi:hypothetical protein
VAQPFSPSGMALMAGLPASRAMVLGGATVEGGLVGQEGIGAGQGVVAALKPQEVPSSML